MTLSGGPGVRGAGVLQMGVASGVLSFLFTDIEGSTRRWEADAAAMRSALQTHDAALRDAIAHHGGQLFKHTGDGVCSAYGTAQRDVAPGAAYDALRRGLKIAQDSGSRQTESSIAAMLSPVAMKLGEPVDAIDYAVTSLRHYYNSGNFYLVKNPLVVLGVLFERLGHYESAAILCGFAINPFTQASLPEINSTVAHLRENLGDNDYESLTRTGEHMSTAEMVAYAFDQIDQISAELRS